MHRRRILALAFALAAVSAVVGTAKAQAAQAHTAHHVQLEKAQSFRI